MNYLIIDDEPLSHDVIIKYAENFDFLKLAHQCYSAVEAINWLEYNSVDLIFLDIKMPKLDGMTFLKRIDNKPEVIIASAHEEYALESFDLDVTDYLLKPFSLDRFFSAVQRARKRKNVSNNENALIDHSIFIKGDKKHHQIRFGDILLIEGYGQYCKIHCEEEVIITLDRLSNIEALLPVSDFVRVHKSFIVSINKIQTVSGNLIEMKGKKVPIGKSYRKSVKEILRIG